jgi:thioredoxin reductase (NADPH)
MSAIPIEVAILGSGPGGSTAALYLARAGCHPVVFHGEVPGGQLTGTTELENFPGWVGTGPDLVAKIEEQAASFGAVYKFEVATEIDLISNPKRLTTDMGTSYTAKAVIIATGASAIWLGLESETRLKMRGVSACATCDGPLYRGKDVIVVGGGDAAVEEALFLSTIANSVYLIHRRDELRASVPMKKKFAASTVKPIWDSVVTECLGDSVLTGLKVQNVKTKQETVLNCHGLFVAIGHAPATSLFKGQIETDQQGYIVTRGSPATSVEGVWACGDCADKVYRQAVTSAGTGCQAALLCEKYLAEHH